MTHPEQALGGRTASGAALMVSARLFTRLIDLATMLVLTRILTPSDFGLVAIAVSLVALTEAVLELPVNQALLRLPVIEKAHYDTAFTIGLIRGGVLGGFLVACAVPFAHWYHDTRLIALICVLSLGPAARGLYSPAMAEFQKALSFWRDFAIELSGKAFSFVCCTAVALLTHSYWALAAGSVLYSIGMTAQTYRFAPYRPRLSLSEGRHFYEFAGWITLAQIVSAINWQFERLLLGKIRPMAQVGLFSTASDIASIPFLALFGPMARPLLAAFAAVLADRERLAASYQKASAAMVAIGLPLLVGESLLAEPMVRLVLGEKWSGAASLVRWLALSLTPALFTLPAMSLLMATGRTLVVLRRNLLELGVKLPIAVVGAFTHGFLGIVVARFVAELAADLYGMVAVRAITGLSLAAQARGWVRPILATAGMALAVTILSGHFPAPDGPVAAAVEIVVCGIGGALVYAALLLTFWFAAGMPDGMEATVWRLSGALPRRLLRQPA